MPITRSDLVIFATGVAAGAVVVATYPKWKGKLEPLLSGVLAGAGAAFSDANSAFQRATESATAEGAGASETNAQGASASAAPLAV